MYRSKIYTRDTFPLAEAFAPGEYIRDELKARGWTQKSLARILGRPIQFVNELVRAKRAITARTAIELGAAFGTGAELWMNLEQSWQLHRAGKPDPAIARRARELSRKRAA